MSQCRCKSCDCHVISVGGHFEVVRCLLKAKSDPDSQDNRKVSCLTAAFRKVRKEGREGGGEGGERMVCTC